MTTGLPAVVLGPNPPDPPKDPAAPPKEPAAPPKEPAVPPKEPAAPPNDPAVPPSDPAVPPSDPAVPPSDPAVPPRDPGAPPLRDEPVREQAERRAQAHATMQAVEDVKSRGRGECHPHSSVAVLFESDDIKPPMNSWRSRPTTPIKRIPSVMGLPTEPRKLHATADRAVELHVMVKPLSAVPLTSVSASPVPAAGHRSRRVMRWSGDSRRTASALPWRECRALVAPTIRGLAMTR
jgi:outer membrane biosynthesis protein TonB